MTTEIVLELIKNEWGGYTVKYKGNSLTKAPYSSLTKALSGKWRQLIPADCTQFSMTIKIIKQEE